MSTTMRAAMPPAPGHAPPRGRRQDVLDAAAQVARAAGGLGQVIQQLRRDPRSRELGTLLTMASGQIWEANRLLEQAATALAAHDQVIADAIGLAGCAAPEPAAAAPARARYLRSVKALVPAGIIAALGAGWRLHRRAAAVSVASIALAGSVGAASVQFRHVPDTVRMPHQTMQAAAVPPALPSAVPAVAPARAHHRRRPHRAPVPPPRPVGTGTPRPRRSPASPPAAHGTITVQQTVIRARQGTRVMIAITASGGPCDWTATATGGVTLGQDSGHLDAGQTVMVPFTADGAGTITFEPGGQAVTVVVELSG